MSEQPIASEELLKAMLKRGEAEAEQRKEQQAETDWAVDLATRRRGGKPTSVIYLTKAEIERVYRHTDPRLLVGGPRLLMGMTVIEVPDEMVDA